MERILQDAARRVIDHIESLPEQPAADTEGADEVARRFVEPLPEHPEDLGLLLDRVFHEAVPKSFNAAGPGYLAYVPGGGLFLSAVADLIADSVNRFTGLYRPAPVLVQLESTAVRWLTEMVGMPEGSGGILTTGGSLANLTAITTARRVRLPEDFLKGTLYVSDQAHHSVTKAAVLAGFPARSVRVVPTDEAFRMRVEVLDEMVAVDRAAGLQPFLVVTSGGTTNTGAVDDLAAVADLAEREELWHHVDGAYGGFFTLTERGRKVLRGIERADSVTLDPHKGLSLPFGTGALVVQRPDDLWAAHAVDAQYLPQRAAGGSHLDFGEISPELSRDFRGLRLWLPLKVHGVAAFAANLGEKLDLTEHLHRGLQDIEGIRILAAPQLSALAFRYEPSGPRLDEETLNALNRRLIEAINDKKRVHLSGTMLGPSFALRVCILSFRTHRDRIDACLKDIRAAVAELRG